MAEEHWILYECPDCGWHWTLAEGERLPDHSQFAGRCTFWGVGVRLSFTLTEMAAGRYDDGRPIRVPTLIATG